MDGGYLVYTRICGRICAHICEYKRRRTLKTTRERAKRDRKRFMYLFNMGRRSKVRFMIIFKSGIKRKLYCVYADSYEVLDIYREYFCQIKTSYEVFELFFDPPKYVSISKVLIRGS